MCIVDGNVENDCFNQKMMSCQMEKTMLIAVHKSRELTDAFLAATVGGGLSLTTPSCPNPCQCMHTKVVRFAFWVGEQLQRIPQVEGHFIPST